MGPTAACVAAFAGSRGWLCHGDGNRRRREPPARRASRQRGPTRLRRRLATTAAPGVTCWHRKLNCVSIWRWQHRCVGLLGGHGRHRCQPRCGRDVSGPVGARLRVGQAVLCRRSNNRNLLSLDLQRRLWRELAESRIPLVRRVVKWACRPVGADCGKIA